MALDVLEWVACKPASAAMERPAHLKMALALVYLDTAEISAKSVVSACRLRVNLFVV